MEGYFFVLIAVAIFAVGSCGNDNAKITCIHGKFNNSIGSDGYTICHQRSGALPIPRIKQCFQDYMKTKQVVKVANKQMTIDGTKFSQYGSANSNTHVGKAVTACSRKPNAQELYKEAARAIQCVFEEIKKTCN